MAKDHDDDSQYENMSDDEFVAACVREFEEEVDADYAKQFEPLVKAFQEKGPPSNA